MAESLGAIVTALGEAMHRLDARLVTAESCTGGAIADAVTALAGSSRWYDRGFVAYSNAAKAQMLAVPAALIDAHGAVSKAVVQAMACGALHASEAQLAIAASGVAGPGGGSVHKPVGTVWLAWAWRDGRCDAQQHRYSGDRLAVRAQAAHDALRGALERALERGP